MAPLFTKALLLGGTTAVSTAVANKLLTMGSKVVIASRQSRLQNFIAAHGSDRVSGYELPASAMKNPKALPKTMKNIIAEHDDVDCLMVNSGTQRAMDFSDPAKVDLDHIQQTVIANYLAPMHMVTACLPHLLKVQAERGNRVHIVFYSTNLRNSLPENSIITADKPGLYNTSDAALRDWIGAMRNQFRAGGHHHARVVEVLPHGMPVEQVDSTLEPDYRPAAVQTWRMDQYAEMLYEGLERGVEKFTIATAPKPGRTPPQPHMSYRKKRVMEKMQNRQLKDEQRRLQKVEEQNKPVIAS